MAGTTTRRRALNFNARRREVVGLSVVLTNYAGLSSMGVAISNGTRAGNEGD